MVKILVTMIGTDSSFKRAKNISGIHDKYKWCCIPSVKMVTLREEILAGRKFGGFGGFCPKPPN